MTDASFTIESGQGTPSSKDVNASGINTLEFLKGLPPQEGYTKQLVRLTEAEFDHSNDQIGSRQLTGVPGLIWAIEFIDNNDAAPHFVGCVINGYNHEQKALENARKIAPDAQFTKNLDTINRYYQTTYAIVALASMLHANFMENQPMGDLTHTMFQGVDKYPFPQAFPLILIPSLQKANEQIQKTQALEEQFRELFGPDYKLPNWQEYSTRLQQNPISELKKVAKDAFAFNQELLTKVGEKATEEFPNWREVWKGMNQ